VAWRQRGQLAMRGRWINDAPLPWPPPISAIAWRRAPRSPRTQAILVIPGAIVSKAVVAALARPATRWPRCGQKPGLGVRLQPGDAALAAAGLLLPRFGLLLSPPVAALLRPPVRSRWCQKPCPAWSPAERPPRQGRFLVLEGIDVWQVDQLVAPFAVAAASGLPRRATADDQP